MYYETFSEKKAKRFLLILVTNKLNVVHSTLFNIIQQPKAMTQTKTFCVTEAEINKFLMQHCLVVQPKPEAWFLLDRNVIVESYDPSMF